jgi:hypothetical protein
MALGLLVPYRINFTKSAALVSPVAKKYLSKAAIYISDIEKEVLPQNLWVDFRKWGPEQLPV